MAAFINTNISSLNAQRNLNSSQGALATSLQRLSSGLRINSAKDDSAGMAIASRMTAQIGGMQQASRNANDGISLSQTAEGAMGSIGDILLRMRDLAVQSSNGSNGTAERKSIQTEVDQLYAEIDRISGTTEFNGLKLLDGSSKNNSFQVGANANQTISFGIKEVSTKAMALNSTTGLGDLNSGRIGTVAPAAGSTELEINGTGITMAVTDTTAKLQAAAINAKTGTTGVTATAYNSLQGTQGASGITNGTLTINGDTVAASGDLNELVANINKSVGGVTASIGSHGELSLTNDDGSDIIIGSAGTSGASGLTDGTYKGYIGLSSGTGSDIALTGTALSKFGFNASTGSSNVTGSVNASAALGTDALAVASLTQSKLLTTDSVKINGVSLGVTGASAAEKASAINAIKDQTGVSATATTTAYLDMATLGTVDSFTINGTTVDLAATDLDTADVVTKINAAGISGITASTDAATGRLKLTSASGSDIVVGNGAGTAVGGVATTATGTATATATATSVAVRGELKLSGEDGAAVRLEGTTASLTKLGLVAQGGNEEAVGGKLSVSTQANAQSAIGRIDKAISFIAEQRSTMGAVQNRLSSTIANLASATENVSAARSRIQDADFAAETATLTRGQILQQAGTAMLAQANSLPNGVLSLLRG